MASTIVTTDEMRSLASKIEGLATEYESIYTNDIYGTGIEQLKAAYVGEDADAVVNQLEGFRDDFQNLKQVIDQYAAYLRSAAKAYDDAQDALTERAKALTRDV